MTVSPAVRVGILVFLAFLALVAVVFFLRGYTFSMNRYQIAVVYDNALGMTEGAEVRMAGVAIGRVNKVGLNDEQRATVVLDINRKYCIPTGSRFIIQSGVVIAQQFIEVVPNRESDTCISSGAEIQGEMPVRLEDLLPKAQTVLANLADTSDDLRRLMGDRQFQRNIRDAAANIARVTARLDQTAALVQGSVLRSQDEVDAIVGNLRLASLNVRSITDQLLGLASEPGLKEDIRSTASSARRSAETLEQAVASAERSAASIERTAASVEGLVTDPKFQEDIRQAVSEARQAAQEAREAIQGVRGIFGGGGSGLKVPTRGLNLDMLYIPDDDRFRAELTTTIPLPKDRFLEVGLYDLGDGNKLILQAGQPVGGRTDWRYGFYAGRLGLGLDHKFSSKAFGRLDLFDTEDVTLDARAGYRFGENWGVLAGVDDLFGGNKATLGVQWAP